MTYDLCADPECGRPMRTRDTLAVDHPGTVSGSGAHGMCQSCYSRKRKGHERSKRGQHDAAVRELVSAGKADREIAAELGASINTIMNVRRRLGMQANPPVRVERKPVVKAPPKVKPRPRRIKVSLTGPAVSDVIAGRGNWLLQAACAATDISTLTEDTDPFFHPEGERGIDRFKRQEAARRICRGCPVSPQCLAYGLSRETTSGRYGMYGGFTEDERARVTLVEVAS